MTLRVGITGGIGTGKTYVCERFRELGIPILNADQLAKRLIRERLSIRSSLIQDIGKNVYLPNGEIDKAYLRNAIFSKKKTAEVVNGIVHPEVFKETERWFSRQSTVYAIKEAALIYESQGHTGFDKIIVVMAPLDIRIQRVMKRDSISKAEVMKRIKSQWPEERKIALADYVISNDGEGGLNEKIQQIHLTLQSIKVDKNE